MYPRVLVGALRVGTEHDEVILPFVPEVRSFPQSCPQRHREVRLSHPAPCHVLPSHLRCNVYANFSSQINPASITPAPWRKSKLPNEAVTVWLYQVTHC